MAEPITMDEETELNKAEPSCSSAMTPAAAEAEAEAVANMMRKDKRKLLKKEKRKQKRKELAEKARQEEEARLNDPEEHRRIEMEEQREKERLERERREFEERERMFLEQLAQRKAQEEEEERRRAQEEEEKKSKTKKQVGHENEVNEEDDWEYIEEGPPEIIWQGNEIIVKKNKVRVKKKDADQWAAQEDPNRPTSNPLPPQSEAFAVYKNAPMVSAQQLLDDFAQQTPNFGTEQDKAHCPFHLKTGACRFGSRCSRVHFYPDKSCTLLIKNMYSGPGLAWEQDEGLEHTDEEVERSYEEFYEDVHTEFLKFGEIINFKVCRNSSIHLRGNVYVHFKSLDSAVLAYHSINGRYFAGKQVTCEFVNVTRWRVAICGEYMKSKLKTCSRGTTCNFIHCFRNPGGDYEWADWDKPPPRYWIKKMAALFGYSDEYNYGKQVEQESSMQLRSGSNRFSADSDRYCSRRSKSKEMESSYRSSRSHHEERDVSSSAHRQKHSSEYRKQRDFHHEKRREETTPRDYHHSKDRFRDGESDRDWSDMDNNDDRHHNGKRRRSRTPRGNSERDWSDRDDDDGRHNDGKRRSRTPDRDNDDDRHQDGYRRRSKTPRVKSERGWSDRDDDDDRHPDGNRRISRTPRVKSEHRDRQGESKSRDHNTDLHADPRNQERDGHSGRKRSKHQENVSGDLDNCKDSKSKARHAESSRVWSGKDRGKEMHPSDKRRTSRHHDEVCVSLDDHWDGRSRTHDGDYTGDWSEEVTDSCYTNNSFTHSNLASGVSGDEETSNGKYCRKVYERAKSRQHRSQKRSYSRGRECSSGEDSEVDLHDECSGLVRKHDKRNFSRHELFQDSDERNLHQYQEGEDSHDKKCNFAENVATSDRCEPDKVVTGKHRKHRRKSGDNNEQQYNKG